MKISLRSCEARQHWYPQYHWNNFVSSHCFLWLDKLIPEPMREWKSTLKVTSCMEKPRSSAEKLKLGLTNKQATLQRLHPHIHPVYQQHLLRRLHLTQSWCKNSHSSVKGKDWIYDFNLLISPLCHYYAIASETFICFLWSAVDGRMMKHKPCFWRNMLQSGPPRTRLPALDSPHLEQQRSLVQTLSRVAQLAPENEGGCAGRYFLNYFIVI